MWKPLSDSGVRLNLAGPRVVTIANQEAAILICYEQLLTWPVLASMFERPTVIVALANDYWVKGTPVPKYQTAAVKS